MKTLDVETFLTPDALACRISEFWVTWNSLRATALSEWDEVRRYSYATDTSTTSNARLPWKNKTTIPKLCQIRDNLISNYMASLFPKRKWLIWEGNDQESELKSESASAETPNKKDVITEYMGWVTDQPQYKSEIAKLVMDYIDTGNCFGTVEWVDQRTLQKDGKVQEGFVGPMPKRISPLDIVFNPLAANFIESPKIVRSIMTIGEVRRYLEKISTDEDRETLNKLFTYMVELRTNISSQTGIDLSQKDHYLSVDGFTSFRDYLASDYVEMLTFYGDMYDVTGKKFYPNHKIIVIDRHKILKSEPIPNYFGYPPIFHAGWRIRQDNLWAMGPLANITGLQYRIDHLENLKADVFDLQAYPVFKIKGYVEDFEYGPMERIYIGDDGDVEMMAPPPEILQVNNEIALLEQMMEEKAGAPKEAMGFRNPGEKTAYEIQHMENAYTRIFMNKVSQFEEQQVEPLQNASLEMARRMMEGTQSIRIFNDTYKMAVFKTLTAADLTGSGRIRPIAARHFAERSERLQNLTNLSQSPLGQDPMVTVHFSGLKTAGLLEELLDLEDYNLVQPFIRVSEQMQAQQLSQSAQQQLGTEAQTPAGTTQDDTGA